MWPLVWGGLFIVASIAAQVSLFGDALFSLGPYVENYDSRGYFALGQQLLAGDGIDGARLAQRGYLYPLVGVGLLKLHPLALLAIQTLANAVSVVLLCIAERRICGRIFAAPLALICVSFLLAPSRLLTESFAVLAASSALLLFLSAGQWRKWGVLAIWIGALVKPALLVPALISLGTVRRRDMGVVVIVLALVATQLVLTSRHDGRMAFSTAGVSNFSERFYPLVVGYGKSGAFTPYRSDDARAIRAATPDVAGQLRELISRPFLTARVWATVLWREHLVQPTGYLWRDAQTRSEPLKQRIRQASQIVNAMLACLAIAGGVGCVLHLLRAPGTWPAAVMAPLWLASAPLVYWQGDRVVFGATLCLLPFVGLTARALWRGLSEVGRGA